MLEVVTPTLELMRSPAAMADFVAKECVSTAPSTALVAAISGSEIDAASDAADSVQDEELVWCRDRADKLEPLLECAPLALPDVSCTCVSYKATQW